jgi:hypothetical protein
MTTAAEREANRLDGQAEAIRSMAELQDRLIANIEHAARKRVKEKPGEFPSQCLAVIVVSRREAVQGLNGVAEQLERSAAAIREAPETEVEAAIRAGSAQAIVSVTGLAVYLGLWGKAAEWAAKLGPDVLPSVTRGMEELLKAVTNLDG